MKIAYGKEKPSIYVYYSSCIDDLSAFHHLIWGIEEEGLPYRMMPQPENTSLKLSYMAAESSSLSVGLGIGSDGLIILHYGKLPFEMPLFQIPHTSSVSVMRAVGANAARLVKGIPFKSVDSIRDIGVPDPECTEMDVESIIVKVLEELKKRIKA
ncbi:glycerol dehydratase reactivase beta/small subunit family protein [Geosporobacter ferrireducens]|uniref:Dehydratase medium subunit n=1 Tax=Geosporobacter ferrireducens TaxID=1424294 RepID=A0A1D8GP92_9FIRM|nr:glycerol dehydratase reactivase beta/small subunit family protein [Geosporobacter ferrireducens]AOT72713.1 hypothetical protein Gferi_26035 [Geosporobacter ferrireducens]MTI55122.1 dehydratase medium subunit [Geosporobacter ferrireducens]